MFRERGVHGGRGWELRRLRGVLAKRETVGGLPRAHKGWICPQQRRDATETASVSKMFTNEGLERSDCGRREQAWRKTATQGD